MQNKLNWIPLVIVGAILLGLTSLVSVNAQGPQPQAAASNVPNTFTYQGQLKSSGGAPVNSLCNLQFSLWDSLSDLSGQVGGAQTINGVSVSNGLFTVVLNTANEFGGNPFDGNARWLKTAVQCGADPGLTALAPRQPLTGAPYALGLKLPVSEAISTTNAALALYNNGNGIGIYGQSTGSWGVGAFSVNNTGLQAHSNTFYGVYSDSGTGTGVAGVSGGASDGVYGGSTFGIGVHGVITNGNPAVKGSNTGSGPGIYGEANNATAAVWGNNAGSGPAVYGSSNGDGVFGLTFGSSTAGVRGSGPLTGVVGVATNSSGTNYGVYGTTASNTGYGVYGANTNSGVAVYGTSGGGTGVFGASTTNYGVYGTAPNGFGVFGVSTGGGDGVWGDNGNSNTLGNAGYFNGRVQVSQDLTTNGLKVNANGTTLKKVEAGTATIGSNGSASTVMTVTFASAFSSAPKVVMTTRNDPGFSDVGDTFVVSTRRISTSQVVVNVFRVDSASGWSQSLKLDWFAWE